MNVYDFDKTIYYPDASIQFYWYCHRHHPTLWFRLMPKTVLFGILTKLNLINEATLIESAYSVIKYLKHPEKDIANFWKKNEWRIRDWYLKVKRSDDLIITASPEYIIKPITDKLGVKMIGTKVDIKTGKIIEGIMKNRGKARYILKINMPVIENFYSDSLTDTPIALLSEHAYMVKKDKILPWPHIRDIKVKKIHRLKK